MSACEKCWSDSYFIWRLTGKPREECYSKLLKEREANPCTPKQQAGDWWDEEKQIDRRLLTPASAVKS
jgi:hypothetical protein